jgi:hypothetical protein
MLVVCGVVWEVEGHASEHDGGEGGFGGVESVGASDDEPDFVVEAFVAAVGQSAVDSGVDSVAMLADRACTASGALTLRKTNSIVGGL